MSWDWKAPKFGNHWVQIEPLAMAHLDEICSSLIPDPNGWYSVMFGLNTRAEYEREICSAEKYLIERSGMGFAIRDQASGEVSGISFYLKMDEENRSLEIGTTNIAPKFRRTYVNTAAKLAMMTYAFETLKCIRVSFRVDEENTVSIKAIERLGAKFGGILRYERILPDGRIRNYRFYSIIDQEWPGVRENLERNLSR